MPNIEHLNELHKAFDSKPIGIGGFDVDKKYSFDGSKVNSLDDFFKRRPKVNVVLLYIDITNFSKKFGKWKPIDIQNLLDNYYSEVIPIIYNYGGEVEKTMGDGIICVFGEPFLQMNLDSLLSKAFDCARDLIVNCDNANLNSKIALHHGEVIYYKTPTDQYREYTIIGNTLTELSRLESISINNSINFYSDTRFDQLVMNTFNQRVVPNHNDEWICTTKGFNVNLPGVSYNNVKTMTYNYAINKL